MLPATYRIIETAFEKTQLGGGDMMLHMTSELIKRPEIRKGLIRMDVRPESITAKTDDYLKEVGDKKETKLMLLQSVENIMLAAMNIAQKNYGTAIEPKDVFMAVAQSGNEYINRLLTLFEMKPGDLGAAMLFSKRAPFRLSVFFPRQFKVRRRAMNRAWTARPTPGLDQHSIDLTDLARSGKRGFLVGHQKEYKRLLDVLSRPGRPNALLVGEPG
jgi:ATP-dependent Clp protease ATP-binding subunit ClpA